MPSPITAAIHREGLYVCTSGAWPDRGRAGCQGRKQRCPGTTSGQPALTMAGRPRSTAGAPRHSARMGGAIRSDNSIRRNSCQQAAHGCRRQRLGQLGRGRGRDECRPMYIEHAALDTRNVLRGKVPPVQRLRGSSSRRAARRGLRTILAAYCPALLEQFESATASRSNWVSEYRKDFERSFGQSRTDAQVAQLMSGMKATHAALAEAERQLGEFIRASFPLPGAASGG